VFEDPCKMAEVLFVWLAVLTGISLAALIAHFR